MSVHTTITQSELAKILNYYDIGELVEFSPIKDGITNSNYLVTTDKIRVIFTLFEDLTAISLPFFFDLTHHLSLRHIPCPDVITDKKGKRLHQFQRKPTAFIQFLLGKSLITPTLSQCKTVGKALAHMHLAGLTFPKKQPNTRGGAWRQSTAESLYALLGEDDCQIMRDEMAFHTNNPINHCPQGIIHGDLFRDNVLFNQDTLTGFIDFYYACFDDLLIDLAIVINDWAIVDGELDKKKRDGIIAAYECIRPLTKEENTLLPVALRKASLRYWLSRLYDYHFPGGGDQVLVKDPNVFKTILILHRSS